MPENEEGPRQDDTVVHVDFSRKGTQGADIAAPGPHTEPTTKPDVTVTIGGESPGTIHFKSDSQTGERVAMINRSGQPPERRTVATDPIGKGLGIFNEVVGDTGIDPSATDVRNLPKRSKRPNT